MDSQRTSGNEHHLTFDNFIKWVVNEYNLIIINEVKYGDYH